MKTKNIVLAFLTAVMALSSCDSLLDIPRKGAIDYNTYYKTDEEIIRVAEGLKDIGLDYICTGHCTKDRAFGLLKEELGDMVNQMQVGYRIVI